MTGGRLPAGAAQALGRTFASQPVRPRRRLSVDGQCRVTIRMTRSRLPPGCWPPAAQPLFAGLGADVAGARALYPLACATLVRRLTDAAGGEAP